MAFSGKDERSQMVAIRKELAAMQREEDYRRGDLKAQSGRYGYVKFSGPGLLAPLASDVVSRKIDTRA